MYHHISDHELIEWCNKWDLLTKIQKRLITLLEESPRVGNYSDIVKFCGINVNNQTANVKQIKKLVEWGIITISDFEEKDKEELEHQIGIAINSRTKTFRLTENWFKTFSDLENNKIMEKAINGVMDKNKKRDATSAEIILNALRGGVK